MKPYPNWLYNEIKQVGTDYADADKVKEYDSSMKKLRNIKEETKKIIEIIALSKNQTLLELGCGTGEFTIEAAKHCSKVYAADVSMPMLEFAKQKAKKMGIKNIKFKSGGFLTYEHDGKPVDAIISQLALHHLPDFWKLIALRRVHGMLKEGGKFYLKDAVYSFKDKDYQSIINDWIDRIRMTAGEDMANDVETAIKEEYTTLDWIMEGLLEKAGFTIDRKEYSEGFMAVYLCTRPLLKE